MAAISGCSGCDDATSLTSGGGDDRGDGWSLDEDACSGSRCDSGGEDTGGGDDAGDVGGVDVGPSCPSSQVCGTGCCESGELCLGNRCVVPGDACEHNIQCPDGQMCEPTMGRCIPQPAQVCEWRPEGDVFDPVVEVAWVETDETPLSAYRQVMMTPAVVDMDEDGIPDILFTTFQGGAYNTEGVLRGVNGRTYEPLLDLIGEDMRLHPGSALALGDIDNDGRNEIVGVGPAPAGSSGGRGLVVFDDHTTGWEVKWRTEGFGLSNDGAALADLDGDGHVEVVAANRVYDGETGELLCMNAEVGGAAYHSVPVDLDGDGKLEVVAGNGAFRFVPDGEGGYECQTMWRFEVASGYFAIGDFGTFTDDEQLFGRPDGLPEIVTVNNAAADQIQLVNGMNGKRIWARTLPTDDHPRFTTAQCEGNRGAGPPTVADFDGDGVPDIATAGACYYVVYEADGTLRWKMPTQDFSSRMTGSSVFDFQGDGKAEVVYGDECFLRVYDGAGNGDGTTDILFEIANTSGTLRELPVIVDVDGDFHADIVVMSNDYSTGTTDRCRNSWPQFDEAGGPSRGIRVIKDRENRWVNTRPVWNQHAYHVTNVCDGLVDRLCPGRENRPGAIPIGQIPNHLVQGLNNFRQNVQGEGLFNAPDLVIVSMAATCGMQGLGLEVVVGNQGSRGVLAGLPVALYAQIEGEYQLVTVLRTTQDLPPGARETLSFDWSEAPVVYGNGAALTLRANADDDGQGGQLHNECVEDNNERTIDVSCPCRNNDDCVQGYWCVEQMCRPVPG